ncbi:hypothetical protein ACSSS7_005511 [Eimeria intestinalis]
MDTPDQFEKLTTFVFRYFDQKKKGHVPAAMLGTMLRSLGQVWSFSELLEVAAKQGDRDVTLPAFQALARARREAETKALNAHLRKKGGKELEETLSVPGLTEAELHELRLCFSLLDPDGSSLCAVNDIVQVLTCLGERLSYSDVQQLLVLEKLEGKGFLNFNEFSRLCARI